MLGTTSAFPTSLTSRSPTKAHAWEFWNGQGWVSLDVDRGSDGAAGDGRRTVFRWTAPSDWQLSDQGGDALAIDPQYWVRARLAEVAAPVWLRRVAGVPLFALGGAGLAAVVVVVVVLAGGGDSDDDDPSGAALVASPTATPTATPTTTPTPIEQSGSSLVVTGFGGSPANTWSGMIVGTTITFNGTRPEDGGTTTASFTLEVDIDAGTLAGAEAWTWTGPGGSCPGSASTVTGFKVE